MNGHDENAAGELTLNDLPAKLSGLSKVSGQPLRSTRSFCVNFKLSCVSSHLVYHSCCSVWPQDSLSGVAEQMAQETQDNIAALHAETVGTATDAPLAGDDDAVRKPPGTR